MIERFSIFGLHNERDVTITFEQNKPYKILVAENGYGKTSILNAFYAILSNDIEKLRTINFDKIEIKFLGNSDVYTVNKDTLVPENTDFYLWKMSRIFERYDIHENLEGISKEDRIDFVNNLMFRDTQSAIQAIRNNEYLSEKIKNHLENDIIDLHHTLKNEEVLEVENGVSIMSRVFDEVVVRGLKILYLPTYRRIEESFVNLYIGERKYEPKLKFLNFGMSDVERKIGKLTESISESFKYEFNKLNSQMLSKFVQVNNQKSSLTKNFVDINEIKLVLKRLSSDYLSDDEKLSILSMVNDETIYNNENRSLFYFVSSLVDVYSKERDKEKLITDFINICNKYLVNKEFVYDDINVKVYVVRKKSRKKIDLHNLSSGEKQIVSIFADIFLDKEANKIIFFDEPELSLSIEWQKMLLKDIIDSNKCKFLFATTHSPFIFDQLIEYTSDLSEYSKEI